MSPLIDYPMPSGHPQNIDILVTLNRLGTLYLYICLSEFEKEWREAWEKLEEEGQGGSWCEYSTYINV